MESKPLKTEVCFNKNIFCETLEQPIDLDFLLPDYCPDISKIFKCKAKPTIVSKGINGNSVTIEGNLCITLLYCDKENNLCSYEYSYPFSKIKEIGAEVDDCSLTCSVGCDYINCRAITGRKIDIHGAVSIKIKAFKRCFNQIVADFDNTEIQLKRAVAPATVPMGYCEKLMILEEDIPLSNNQATVLRVLRYDAVPSITEHKVINDKIVAKGEMAVTVLYSVDGVKAPMVLKTTLPFSQIVEMSGVTELCKCDIKCEIAFLEVRPALSFNGECNAFSLNAKLLLKCESYCVNDIAIIEDAFSTRFETNVVKNTLSFKKICENFKENCQLKKSIELSENIASVVDIWCEKGSKKVKLENGKVCLSGVLLIGMVVCDQNDNVVFYEKPVELEFEHKTECEGLNLSANTEIDIVNVGYTITSANCLEVRIELCITGTVYETNDIPLITDIEIDTNKPLFKNKKGGMLICFASKGEKVWNIARKYNANLQEIVSINNLAGDELENKKTILIPLC